jgi:hypothetical protein
MTTPVVAPKNEAGEFTQRDKPASRQAPADVNLWLKFIDLRVVLEWHVPQLTRRKMTVCKAQPL